MNDEQYLLYCRELLAGFAETLCRRTDSLPAEDSLRVLANDFRQVAEDSDTGVYYKVAPLVDRLFTTYPEFAPTFPRELLWFFGGDCLHFMPDEEIALYQQLDDMRCAADARGEIFDLQSARAKLLNLQ